MVNPDVVRQKVAIITTGVAGILEAQGAMGLRLRGMEEVALLSLRSPVKACRELAEHIVASEEYGVPGAGEDPFALLERHGVIDAELAAGLRLIAGFPRSVLPLMERDFDTGERILEDHLGDLRRFAARVVDAFGLGA